MDKSSSGGQEESIKVRAKAGKIESGGGHGSPFQYSCLPGEPPWTEGLAGSSS